MSKLDILYYMLVIAVVCFMVWWVIVWFSTCTVGTVGDLPWWCLLR